MQALGAGGLREFQAAVQMSHVAGGSPLAPVTQNQSFGLPHGLQSLAAHHGLANSEALSAFPFAVKPTNLMKPSQCKPRGLLEKDSSTTLFRSSRLHHFHFTAFQREIIKQNYKHNEERKKERREDKSVGERSALYSSTGLLHSFTWASKYHLVSLCRAEHPGMPAPAAGDKRQ